MTRAHGTNTDGQAVNLIGKPLEHRQGPAPGVSIVESEQMSNAPHDGIYTLNGMRFLMRKGTALPEGAVIEPNADEPEAKQAPEPENKAQKGPEKK